MYLAEFTYPGTFQLVNDLLIDASEAEAREFAQYHAMSWGVEVFSLVKASEQQIDLYRRMRKVVTLELSVAALPRSA